MKKLLAALLIAISLTGCGSIGTSQEAPKPSVIVQYQYVTNQIPDETLVIPPMVDPIDVSKSTQKDVADWLARSEGRTTTLENNLKAIQKIKLDQIEKAKENK